MRGWVARLLVLAAALAPAAASGDNAPQVVMASPGGPGGQGGGAIERFTARFSEAMVPLGDPRAASPFTVACPVAGQGRWIDPQTFVHEFAGALPGGLSCRFTLRDGLASLRGAAIGGQRSFTVDTGGPAARVVLPGRYGGDIDEDQTFLVAANTPADRASIAANAYCAVDGIGEKIAVDLLPQALPAKLLAALGPDDYKASSFLSEAGLPATIPASAAERARTFASVVALKCRRPLPPWRDVALVWGARIRGPGGRLAGTDQRFDFTVRKAFEARFECSRVNPQAGCNPVEKAYVRFSAPIPLATAKAVRIDLGNGKTLLPSFADAEGHDDVHTNATVSDLSFAGLPASTVAHVVLPADVRDDSGRPLANAQRFPLEVRFDAAPPLVKFAATFGIIEAAEGGVLPVTVRSVEPALRGRILGVGGQVARIDGDDGRVARWLRDLDRADENSTSQEKRGRETVTINTTGAAPLLDGGAGGKPLKLALPGKGRDFEVVGIPLGRPGFYVVELASPALGRSLLGRAAPRYVATGALVTNMAVHFKWGRAASLAWITALDSGRPVAGAAVRVTNSCTGATLAVGTSDAAGRLLIRGGRLPEPAASGSCDEDQTPPLMVSARKGGDFSFALTDWGEGIRPYDFELDYGWSKPDDILHTVFDRSLIRAGETINMKHVLRRPVATGLIYAGAIRGTLRLTHTGSGTQFEMPLTIGTDGIGLSSWTAPKGAPLGDYSVSAVIPAGPGREERTIDTGQSFRVDEFRLPTMRATVAGPKAPSIAPKTMPLDLYVGYLSGGGAAGLPVSLRAAFEPDEATPAGWDGWSFGGRRIVEGVKPLNGDNEEDVPPSPPTQTLPVSLDRQGAARTSIEMPAGLDGTTKMTVEMDYQDANGETLTASNVIPVYGSGVRVGIKTDGWLMKQDDLRLRLAAIDPQGHPIRGKRIAVALYSREILSARRRLIGGFYAYDNNARTTRLSAACSVVTDNQGLASCALDPGTSGEVYAVATATDDQGRETRTTTSVWLAGDDEWWFGGDNGDRMDLVPEAKSYKAGETARFQVRMPFRSATALVTVERERVLSSFVTTLSGKDPVVEVPMPGSYAPDVYVSVMAVRGRVSGWRLWLAQLARDWHLPWFSRDGAQPTALVDLAKPSYRIGIAKVEVGWEAHSLDVAMRADKERYHVRDVAKVAIAVRDSAGRVPAQAEIAFAAVDEALLQLAPNDSWHLIDAMMGERPISVLTSSAQTQVVGKRHYGRKAVAAGGGGGGDMAALNREDFRPVLLWKGRVPLDARGFARVAVPLSDSLSSFKLVAIATAGADRFGTGETSVRTTQELSIYSGVPPLIRSGDWFGASFTLRNGSDKPMRVTATVQTTPRGAAPPLTVTIPAGGAAPVTWHLTAPLGLDRINWKVTARSADGRAVDAISVSQTVVPPVPVETWAASLVRVGGPAIPIGPPIGAIPGRGGVEIALSATLAPPLAGVRDFMAAYPFHCFEQDTSRAVALGDVARWNLLAGDIPAYLDGDGLLRYFPSDALQGDPALTAYILSITAEAGFTIPEGSRAKMTGALQAVVDGRLTRDGGFDGDKRLIRLAALAALARNNAATPAMLGQIGIAPRDMTTTALADWLTALGKVGTPPQRAEAEAYLRRRIVYEGTRLDLTDHDLAPWWMMTSSDEMAARAVLAVLGRPGWQDETPRLMAGFAARQLRGHWDTTPANAWGAVLTRRFSGMFPAGAVAGTTTARLAGLMRSRGWPQAADAPPLLMPLPAAPQPLVLAQSGGAGPWATVSVKAAVPLTQPLFAGYRIARQVGIIQQRVPGRLTRGDVLRIRLTVDASAERNWVVVSDPIPAGATIVGDLGGQSAMLANQASQSSGGAFGALDAQGKPVVVEYGAQPAYVERGQDAWRGYFEWVPRGRFVVEYAVRLNGAGRFQLPPTRVEAMYSPEIRGTIPNRGVVVAMR